MHTLLSSPGADTYLAHSPVMDSVGMALSSMPRWPRTHRASSRFTWEGTSCAGTRGSATRDKKTILLGVFFLYVVHQDILRSEAWLLALAGGEYRDLGFLL